jgi:hypothetical protein
MVSAVQQQLIQASLAPAKLANDVSTAVAGKVLDSARQQGAAVLQLLDNAVPPSPTLGTQLDVSA